MEDFNFIAEKAQTSSEFSLVPEHIPVLLDVQNTVIEENILQSDISTTEVKERVVYNAVELMALGNIEPKYLMRPFFPQKGTAVLAGKPDTGKSQFARQLCIQVALGEETFLGFNLSPVYNRSIYVATEDNLESTTSSLSKQFNGLGKEAVENIRFIFADAMDQDEILKKLEAELIINPVDLVVVDSFGDIFTGGDSNNNMAMRNTVKQFDRIAKRHGCLILFVHHTNKGSYNQAPKQEHIQGGSGLTQKVRLAILLSDGPENKRYFTVVKGNYCPKVYKENSVELEFSEDNLLFTNTGTMILSSSIGSSSDDINERKKKNILGEIVQAIFADSTSLSYNDFVKQFCKIKGKSEATAKRTIKTLVTSGFVEKHLGNYRLKNVVLDEGEVFDEEIKNESNDEPIS